MKILKKKKWNYSVSYISGDGVLAGTNWNGDLVGREIDPFELREIIEANMTSELLEKHEQKYNKLT